MTHRKSYMFIIDPNSHERRHQILAWLTLKKKKKNYSYDP